MGLRIGSDSGGLLGTLRGLNESLLGLRLNQERIASGLRINRAADDPAGLVISELLRSQIGSFERALENTEQGARFVDTAEGALSEVSSQLIELRSQTLRALNSGGFSDEARNVVQDQVDNILGSIDRIASTTRFGSENLLNGEQGFVLSGVSASLTGVQVQQADLAGGPQNVQVQVTSAATQATAGTIGVAPQAGSTIRISGELGTATVDIAAGASQGDVIDAINAQSAFTGVFASSSGDVFSTEFGSDASVQIDVVSGSFGGPSGNFNGTDVVGTINGQAAAGSGNTLSTNGPALTASVTVDPAAGAGTFSFDVVTGGATFQLGGEVGAFDRVQLGVDSIATSFLGGTSGLGSLASLGRGGANNVLNSPGDALRIVDSALDELNGVRGNLGSVVRNVFEPNARSLSVAIENLSASESQVRDADFALEVARSVRNQVLSTSGIRALGQQNLLRGSVLDLLR